MTARALEKPMTVCEGIRVPELAHGFFSAADDMRVEEVDLREDGIVPRLLRLRLCGRAQGAIQACRKVTS